MGMSLGLVLFSLTIDYLDHIPGMGNAQFSQLVRVGVLPRMLKRPGSLFLTSVCLLSMVQNCFNYQVTSMVVV